MVSPAAACSSVAHRAQGSLRELKLENGLGCVEGTGRRARPGGRGHRAYLVPHVHTDWAGLPRLLQTHPAGQRRTSQAGRWCVGRTLGAPQPPQRPPTGQQHTAWGLPLAPGLRLSAGGQAALPPPDKPWGTVSCAQGQQGASWGCDLGFYLKPSSRRVTDPTSARSSSGHKPTK